MNTEVQHGLLLYHIHVPHMGIPAGFPRHKTRQRNRGTRRTYRRHLFVFRVLLCPTHRAQSQNQVVVSSSHGAGLTQTYPATPFSLLLSLFRWGRLSGRVSTGICGTIATYVWRVNEWREVVRVGLKLVARFTSCLGRHQMHRSLLAAAGGHWEVGNYLALRLCLVYCLTQQRLLLGLPLYSCRAFGVSPPKGLYAHTYIEEIYTYTLVTRKHCCSIGLNASVLYRESITFSWS